MDSKPFKDALKYADESNNNSGPNRAQRRAEGGMSNKQIRKNIDSMLTVVQANQGRLDTLIGATPTGDMRNAMCDANIHLMACIEELKKAYHGDE